MKACCFCHLPVYAPSLNREYVVISFTDGREDELAHPECLELATRAFCGTFSISMNGGVQ